MSDKEKIKEVIRYMETCINDARKIGIEEYIILKRCYEYPLKILGGSDE